MENQNQEKVHITGKQIEYVFLLIIATLVGFVVTSYFIVPGLSFQRFFLIELTVTGSATIVDRIFKARKK